MNTTCTTRASRRQRVPLATAIATLLGLSAGNAVADTLLVTSCDDDGTPGTLRSVIASAADSDTVDFSGLSSCQISLATGAISVAQPNLTIVGSLDVPVIGVVDGARLFTHNNSGTLAFDHVAMGLGKYKGPGAGGGCIASAGNVALFDSYLALCTATASGTNAFGGAIYALGDVTVKYSQITGSRAFPASGGKAYGGAILSVGDTTLKYATITDAKADPDAIGQGIGGGIYSVGGVALQNSTISDSYASFVAGAFLANVNAALYSSTISGNQAPLVGGVVANGPNVNVVNSTIAFNTSVGYGSFASGLAVLSNDASTTIKMQSSILSNNGFGANYDFDFSQNPSGMNTITFDPASGYNLIRLPGPGNLPADTILFGCPRLGRLRDNGGLTFTHALNSFSLAIDAGDNPGNETTDQRGDAMLYPRVSNGFADIGAYEVNQDDIVFTDDSETCKPVIF